MMRIQNEINLILLCSHLSINETMKDQMKLLLSAALDWEKIKKIADNHHLTPLLYYNLNKISLEKYLPQDVLEAFKASYFTNIYFNAMAEEEITRILEVVSRKKLSIVFLKGFALMKTLYLNQGLRMMCDVDILIKEEELLEIKNILTQLDFSIGAQEALKQEQKYEIEMNFTKQINISQVMMIDVHWKLAYDRPYKLNLPFLWERTQKIRFNEQELTFLSYEDTFLFLVLHIKKHVRSLTLNFIIDIAEFLNKYQDRLNWAYISKIAKSNHILVSVYFSLYLADEFLSIKAPSEILRFSRPNFIKRGLIRILINKCNFLKFSQKKAISVRFLLFDYLFDSFIYFWRVSFWERYLHG